MKRVANDLDRLEEQRHDSIIVLVAVSKMGSKNHKLFEELSKDEQDSLIQLCRCGGARNIPDDHAEKFLGLGFAELNCGGVSATRAGRTLVARSAAH